MVKPSISLKLEIQVAQIRAQVKRMTYEQRRQFLKRSALPQFLYKYRSLDPSNEISINRIRDILLHSKLWLSSPADFNDPFDMSAKIEVGENPKDIRRRLDQILRGKGYGFAKRQREIRRHSTNLAELQTLVQEPYDRLMRSTGVYSFAGTPLSILMWSHYGSNHQGLCLQFDVAEDPDTFLTTHPIEYIDEYPVIRWTTNFGEDIHRTLLRKFTGWQYERESRIVLPDQAHSFIKFNPRALKRIIIGCDAKGEMVTKLCELIGERPSIGLMQPSLYHTIRHQSNIDYCLKNTKESRSQLKASFCFYPASTMP